MSREICKLPSVIMCLDSSAAAIWDTTLKVTLMGVKLWKRKKMKQNIFLNKDYTSNIKFSLNLAHNLQI